MVCAYKYLKDAVGGAVAFYGARSLSHEVKRLTKYPAEGNLIITLINETYWQVVRTVSKRKICVFRSRTGSLSVFVREKKCNVGART